MQVDRLRLVLALILVAIGSSVVAGGPGFLRKLASLLVSNAHVVLLALAVLLILVSALPQGTRIGPVVLIVGGVLAYALIEGHWRAGGIWAATGALLVFLGGRMALVPGNTDAPVDPVMRATAIFYPRTVRVVRRVQTPEHIAVIAVGTRVVIDLREPGRVDRLIIEISLSCWAAYTEILLPDSWAVVGGRLASARGVTFRGKLDSDSLYPYPREKESRKTLESLSEERARQPNSQPGIRPAVAVIHVLGVRGVIELGGRR